MWYCNKHNKEFKKFYSTLISCKSGCNLCYKENMMEVTGLGIDGFKDRLQKTHPSLVVLDDYINYSTPISFYCKEHDYTFVDKPVSVLTRSACCQKTFARYKEEVMCTILENWGYNITRQKTFDGCKDKTYLPFDCYLDDFNTCIEYDGEQHFKPVKFGEQSYEESIKKFKYTKFHDSIKNNFCKENNITLIRVPYYEFENLEYFLFDQLSSHKIIIETA